MLTNALRFNRARSRVHDYALRLQDEFRAIMDRAQPRIEVCACVCVCMRLDRHASWARIAWAEPLDARSPLACHMRRRSSLLRPRRSHCRLVSRGRARGYLVQRLRKCVRLIHTLISTHVLSIRSLFQTPKHSLAPRRRTLGRKSFDVYASGWSTRDAWCSAAPARWVRVRVCEGVRMTFSWDQLRFE